MIYTSSQFHLQYIAKYQLIVQANFNYDILYVVDSEGQLLVYMKYESNSPSEEALKILSLPFQKVYVSISHNNLTFIPNDLYDMEDVEKYQDFMEHPGRKAESVSLDFLQAQAFYQYDVLLEQRWRSLFPHAQFIPEFKLNLMQARPHIPLQGEVLGVVFHEQVVDLFLFINGQFKLYNSFEVYSEEDLSYYVLHLFQVFGIDGKVSKVLYSSMNAESPYIGKLAEYGHQVMGIRSQQALSLLDELPSGLADSYLLELPKCAL
ncbi:DUF3822 family protein [Sphingobacterium sp. 1.A.4]|uniref:DUF3822 family protein n=1 Tax=Sphingobacterium sp. 1.A.4 TaxID=2044603 RepID=UPI000C0BC885|nr:DUF3822 family protein [Sphingobacterium sp. 1.A.4]